MSSHPLRPLLLIVFSLLQWLPSKQQPVTNGYTITHYNSDNALPQNSINAMAFDKNGFLWLATRMGIVRFDGKNFREYNSGNCPALLWNEYSIPQREPGTNKLFFKPVFDSAHIFTLNEDYQIVMDSARSAARRHLITSNNHLFFYNGLYNTYSTAYKKLFDKLATSYAPVTVNERQAYYYDDGLCYFLDENTRSIKELREITGHTLKLQFITGGIYFFIDDQYRVYAYKNGELQKNVRYAQNLKPFFIQAAAANPDPVQASLKTRRDGNHTLMLCNDTILLLRMVNNILDYKILAADIPMKDIKCMIYDEGYQALYIGTITNGLYVLKLHEMERLFFNDPTFMVNSQSLQLELPGSNILTSTGILNYSNYNHILFSGTHDFDKQAWLQASDGSIWLSEFDSLKRTDIHLRSFVTVKSLGYYLTGIIERSNKDIIYSNKHQVFRRHGTEDTILLNANDLMHAEIHTLKEVDGNNLWIGTSAGVFCYDLSKSRARAGLSRLSGLEKMSIDVIHIAKDSSIWIGTYGQGFYKFYKNQVIKMPLDSRKSLVIAHCFMEDRQGYFWIPTNKGLFRVEKKELDNYAAGSQSSVYYYYVDKSYGFTTNEFNGWSTPCGIVTRDNYFSLPSLDGLVRFNPDSVHIPLPDNPVFIELLMADDKRLLVKNKLEVSRDSSQLVFEISSPYFGNPFNQHLEYAIQELNDKWYPVNDDGKLVIPGLNSGTYTLTVRSQHPHAHYIYNKLSLTILPYWYEQWWFKLLLGALATGAFLMFFRLRYNYQVQRAQLLQQKVDERTAQLSESNRVKELMIAAILHDLRSPLRFLHLLARRMYNNYKTSADKELSQILFQFDNATNEIYDFTQDFFVFINMQKEGFVIKKEKIVLRDLVGEIISFCEMGARIQKNTFSNQVPADITLHTDVSLLSLVLRNLADNANKYTSEGIITIEGIQDAFTTRIIMTDGGNPMNKELVARILDKSYNPTQHGMGWGYKIIIEILGRLHGSLDIVPGNEKGNIITITFENKGFN